MRIKRKSTINRRIIRTDHIGPYEVAHHATKGYRTRRLYSPAKTLAGVMYRSFIGA